MNSVCLKFMECDIHLNKKKARKEAEWDNHQPS